MISRGRNDFSKFESVHDMEPEEISFLEARTGEAPSSSTMQQSRLGWMQAKQSGPPCRNEAPGRQIVVARRVPPEQATQVLPQALTVPSNRIIDKNAGAEHAAHVEGDRGMRHLEVHQQARTEHVPIEAGAKRTRGEGKKLGGWQCLKLRKQREEEETRRREVAIEAGFIKLEDSRHASRTTWRTPTTPGCHAAAARAPAPQPATPRAGLKWIDLPCKR